MALNTNRMLEALFFIVLSVALSDRDAVIDIVQPHAIVGHVSDRAGTTASLEVCRLLVERVGPNLNASAFGGVVHRDVADENILHDIDTLGVLSERSNGDAVCAIARQVLNKNVGSVWLKGYAIYWGQQCPNQDGHKN